MEEELLRIIYDYSFSYKLGDETFINKINEILFYHYNITKDEVESIDFGNNIAFNALAAYFVSQKKLYFNVDNIYIASNKKRMVFNKEMDEYLFHNFFILSCILHEYIHVLQYREKKELDNIGVSNDNKKLLDYSFLFSDMEIRRRLNIKKLNYDNYISYHDYFPIERMAIIKSSEQILNLINLDSTLNGILEDFYKQKYYAMLVFGYGINNILCGETSPLEEYLFKIDLYYLYQNFSFYDIDNLKKLHNVKQNYTINERLLYGFPIDKEEKEELNNKNINAKIKLSKHL